MITITRGDRQAAFAASAAYAEPSLYVPPLWSDFDRMLDPARNPLVTEGHGRFELFTALRDGVPVGRIVACVHEASNRLHGAGRAQFGFFDCEDDVETARVLLSAAEDWARAQGCTRLSGNFNLTAMQQIGVMTDGFGHSPYTDMVYSPPHVATHLSVLGYRPVFPMTTFETDVAAFDPERLIGPKQREILSDASLQWLTITRAGFRHRLEEARLVLNDGFADNPMFVPPTRAEYLFQAGEMLYVIDKRISVMVHHLGQPIGVIIIIPDLNPLVRRLGGRFGWSTPFHYLRHRLTNRRAVLIYQSVNRAWHGRGLNGAMLYKAVKALKGAGYDWLGTTWIADVNAPSLRQMEKIGAKPLHRLHLFEKELQHA
jgi:GNAT superfamily N-acetyltransferase